MMTLYEWFDPNDYTHIRAYRNLERNGYWPEGFIPEDVEVRSDGLWNIELTGKMAQAWMHSMEHGDNSS